MNFFHKTHSSKLKYCR